MEKDVVGKIKFLHILKPYKQNIVGYDTQHRNNLVIKNTKKYYKLKKVNRRRQKNYK